MANSMNESLWGTLPKECLDHIVAFLPLPSLSRFRVVSKKYNAWILSEEFIKLCAQLPLRGSQVWMTYWERSESMVSTNFRVCVDSKLLGSAHEAMLPDYGRWSQNMRSALGSLLLVGCSQSGPFDGSYPTHHLIYDVSTMTCSRLPQPIVRPTAWYGYSHVMFGQCGEDTGAFKIAIIDELWDQQYQVYNSVTQSWKILYSQQFAYGKMINCTFIFDKIFFLSHMYSMVTGCYGIVAFDTNTEKYESMMMITTTDEKQVTKKRKEIRTNFILGASYGKLASLKLIAANGRLFLTGWIEGKVLHVFEVDLPNMQLMRIAELPMSLMQNITSADVQIRGHRDCILLCSIKEGNVVYDFCRKKWHGLRDCPLFRERYLFNVHYYVENGNEWDAGV